LDMGEIAIVLDVDLEPADINKPVNDLSDASSCTIAKKKSLRIYNIIYKLIIPNPNLPSVTTKRLSLKFSMRLSSKGSSCLAIRTR
jgi:hypothetical protein